jgi:21S rRNA (uridine2791-2'-O)-methyltransferase
MDKTYRIFSRGSTVVDLGYAPGSWSQVAKDRVGRYGIVVGIDLIPHQPPPGVSTIQGDFLDPRVQEMAKAFIEEAVWKKSIERRARAEEEEKRRKQKDDSDGEVEESVGEEDARGEDVVIQQTSYIEAERASAREVAEARKMEQEKQNDDGEEVTRKRSDEQVVSVSSHPHTRFAHLNPMWD